MMPSKILEPSPVDASKSAGAGSVAGPAWLIIGRAMKLSLKYTFLCALLVVAIQFWALAVISAWLPCDDLKAVQDFTSAHRSLACVAALIWGADREFFGRYLVMLVLGTIFWWVMKQKAHEPHA